MHNKKYNKYEIKLLKLFFLKISFKIAFKMSTISDFLKNLGKPFHRNGAHTLKARQSYHLVVERLSCLSKGPVTPNRIA